jgi:hypothetical protein
MKEKNKSVSEKELHSALVKKAFGYNVKEVVEEYVSDESGDVKLTKKKVTKKNVPPDITALKLLMDTSTKLNEMSDEELEMEKIRLLKLLSDAKKEN